MEKIAVIGGGAAGMMASIFAARRGMAIRQAFLWEIPDLWHWVAL